MLYREDYQYTFPDVPREAALSSLEFTSDDIQSLGEIKDVLERFLEEQQQSLQYILSQRFPNIPDNIIRQILDAFVTDDGTKRVIPFKRGDNRITLESTASDFLRNLDLDLLSFCLQELENRRILRANDQTFELAHDSLANLIDKGRSDEQRQLNEVKNRIKNGYIEFEQSNVFFTERQILSIEDFLPKINLPKPHEKFLAESRKNIQRIKQKEQEEQEEKLRLAEQKLFAERKARRRQQIFLVIIGLIAIIAIWTGLWADTQRKEAEKAGEDLSNAIIQQQISTAKTFKSQGDYTAAFIKIDSTYAFSTSDSVNNLLNTYKNKWLQESQLVARADSLLQIDSLNLALETFNLAFEIESAPLIATKIRQTQQQIDNEFLALRGRALQILNFDGCQYAMELLENALRLKEDPELREALNNCRQ